MNYKTFDKSQVNLYQNRWLGIAIFLLISLISVSLIYSIEYKPNDQMGFWNMVGNFKFNFSKQVMWIALALIIGNLVLVISVRYIFLFSYVLYAIGVLLMVLTLLVSTNTRGSNSWLSIGFIKFQPASLMLVCTLLAFVKYTSDIDFNIKRTKNIAISVGIFVLPCILTIMQKEMGFALVFLSFIIPLYVEGVTSKLIWVVVYLMFLLFTTLFMPTLYMLIVLASIFILLTYLYGALFLKRKILFIVFILGLIITYFLYAYAIPLGLSKVLKPYQLKRIYALTSDNDINTYTKNLIQSLESKKGSYVPDNYNGVQALIAVGSGGVVGKGFLNNTQTRLNFVPEQTTDFIFCAFAESYGFVGIFLFMVLFIYGFIVLSTNAEKKRNNYVRIYTYGFFSIILMHIIINVGMVVGLLPIIGIPLPFISYGGSSMLTMGFMYFVLLKLHTSIQLE